jgi:hypothetical protein
MRVFALIYSTGSMSVARTHDRRILPARRTRAEKRLATMEPRHFESHKPFRDGEWSEAPGMRSSVRDIAVKTV